ncbi:MAG: THUMP-like domain-containing protein [Bacteroidia bacterium]
MKSKSIIDLLSNETITKFIGLHIKDDVKKLALNANKYTGLDIKVLSTLISLYQKAEIKLPEHYTAMAALNPKSYEQSTSEAVAKYKAGIMNIKNKHIINVTGGIGIDDWAMAQLAKKIDSCDMDEDIHIMSIYNISLFKTKNIERHLVDGIEFIKHSQKTDIIYADPDRRPNAARIFRLEDSEPDILKNMEILLDKADEVWLKISPMADISYLQKVIPSINNLYVIAWLGEVKEILLCCSKNKASKKNVFAVNIGSKETSVYQKTENTKPASYCSDGLYLYEPNKSIIKAGLSADYANYCGLNMLSINSYFFISDHLKQDFFGRSFKIIEKLAYKPKEIKRYLEDTKIYKANITTRNFRETAETLKKRFKLNDGGIDYLCFTIDTENQSWLYHCIKNNEKY